MRVNADAPKAGRIRVPQMGNWDNFNPVTAKGQLAAGIGFWDRDQNLLRCAGQEGLRRQTSVW